LEWSSERCAAKDVSGEALLSVTLLERLADRAGRKVIHPPLEN